MALGDVSQDDAKADFCALLEERVPSYRPWLMARLRERRERQRRAREQAERERLERERAQREALERQRQEQLKQAQAAQRREAELQARQHGAPAHQQAPPPQGQASAAAPSSASASATAAAPSPLDLDITSASRLPRSQLTDERFIEAFRAALRNSPESEALVGSGETLTVRVPMPSGRRTQILWQFTTEERDISFGVDFERKAADGSLHIEPVLKITRINAHLEVVTGSHVSDDEGTWLLKFDNSYSYFRSKTILYRVLCSEV